MLSTNVQVHYSIRQQGSFRGKSRENNIKTTLSTTHTPEENKIPFSLNRHLHATHIFGKYDWAS